MQNRIFYTFADKREDLIIINTESEALKPAIGNPMLYKGITWFALYILLVAGFAAWFFLYFPTASPGDILPEASFRIKKALIGGLVVAIPAWLVLCQLSGVWLRIQEREQLVQAAKGHFLADGERGVFYGQIHRDGPPLTAPLSKRDCLLYRYEVTHTESRPSRLKSTDVSNNSTIYDAEGFALTPSTIHTASGSLKLLTLVTPKFKADRIPSDQAVGNYKEYLSKALLQGTGSLDMYPSIKNSIISDTDGDIRYDLGTGQLDPTDQLNIQEHIVQDGETVAVFGKYSAAVSGIVFDPVAYEVRLYKGSLESMKKELMRGVRWYAFGAMILCLVTAIGAWVFFKYGPSHIWS
ncbi:MAG TPA: hypothetical protein PLA32_03140 [Smithella sp.]|nr:hypothetical protein [Smithella sp.]